MAVGGLGKFYHPRSVMSQFILFPSDIGMLVKIDYQQEWKYHLDIHLDREIFVNMSHPIAHIYNYIWLVILSFYRRILKAE